MADLVQVADLATFPGARPVGRSWHRALWRLGIFILAGVSADARLGASPAMAASDAPEPLVEGKTPELTRLVRQLHETVHPYWKGAFAGESGRTKGPLNDPRLRVVYRLVLSPGGILKNTKLIETSKVPAFDEMVTKILWERAPFTVDIPAEAVDEDGQTYIEWAFARDARLCSGIRWVRKVEPVEEAVPRLLAAGKPEDAWKWLRDCARESPERVMGWYARFELAKALTVPQTAVPAAVGLLAAGDQTGLATAQAAITQGLPAAPLAARGFARLKMPICPLVKNALQSGTNVAKESALSVLDVAPDKDCTAALLALLANPKDSPHVRLTALRLLLDSADAPSREAALKLAKDDSQPGLKAVGLLASVQPGGGRATVFRMVPFLKDPAVELRAASAAGVVRAAGDAELDQLYRLFSEKDPRPYEWVAQELSKFGTGPTLELLTRMLKKEDRRIRVAATRALGARSDAAARHIYESLAKDADAEIAALVQGKTNPALLALSLSGASPERARRIYSDLVPLAQHRALMADWLLAQYRSLAPLTQAEVLQEWLCGAPVQAPAPR